MNTPYIIAEIGVNFYDTAKSEQITPMEAAKKYIDEAKNAGLQAVKFQAYKADTIVSKNSPAYWDLAKEPTTTQYELFQKHDGFCKEDYMALYSYCRSVGIDFLCTPFDMESADFLDDMLDIYKISSSDLNNLPFLKQIANKNKPVYLSTGAAYLSEIEEAVRVLKREGCPEICLLHCVLSYPTKHIDGNLAAILTLKRIFPDLKIGYSDHIPPDPHMTVLTTAYLYGAEVIEKHFTLDKTLSGNDHYHAGDPQDFKTAVENFKLIGAVSGSGEIEVLDCEVTARREARRSLVLTRDMKEGERIEEADIMLKRPGKGIPPKDIELVIGRAVKKDLTEDTVLTWDMV